MKKIKLWKFSSLIGVGTITAIAPVLTVTACGDEDANWQQYFNVSEGKLDSLTELGKQQTSLRIPKNVTSISADTFRGCATLTNLIIPNSVISIAPNVFNTCSALKNVTNNSTVLFDWWVNHHDYNGQTLSQMSEIDLGKIQNSGDQLFIVIADNAFDGCKSLSSVFIPSNITAIGNQAFANCSSTAKYTVFSDQIRQALIKNLTLTLIKLQLMTLT